MRITVLDQDKERGEAACAALRAVGHRCTLAAHADAIPTPGTDEAPDLLILDDASGKPSVLVERLRQTYPALPILLASTRAAENEIVAALAAGADDYLIKPARQGDIVARVQVLLKRSYPDQHADQVLRFGRYAFETGAARVIHDEKAIEVTQKEFDLALLFFRNIGRPLSRTYIREVIWPGESELPSRTLDTHVSRVRSKLGLRPESGYQLVPVYSFGYQLEQLRG